MGTSTPRASASIVDAVAPRSALYEAYVATRTLSEALAEPLTPEDQVVQSMPDASPTKWHRAHTTWFFETFLLIPYLQDYRPFNKRYGYLFNSYYEAAGPRHPRPRRGMLSRPTVTEVTAYRAHVDAVMTKLIEERRESSWPEVQSLIELGINHEQQHQELLLTDILHLFSLSPLRPAYRAFHPSSAPSPIAKLRWIDFEGDVHEVGADGLGFAFDNERPRHRVLLRPFRLASRPVTNGEWKWFIADGGYQRPELWLSDGWVTVMAEAWQAPLYWQETETGVCEAMTLNGMQPLDEEAPVAHVSFYEADAFARWAGKRLPTEAEWEIAAAAIEPRGNTLGSGFLRPQRAPRDGLSQGLVQMFGDVWEWTRSPYGPYPGYRPPSGAIGEYNGKFMCNQFVLKGGSCVTPDGHVRASYRNFFYPHQRWQFSGLRLAEDG